MSYYLVDEDATSLLSYSQASTLVRQMYTVKSRCSVTHENTTYTANPGDVICDLDPTFLPASIPADWTLITDVYAYRSLLVAAQRAEQLAWYVCDISADSDGNTLLTYTGSDPRSMEVFFFGGAVTLGGVTTADGDFLVGFHPDEVPTIPSAGWTKVPERVAIGLRSLENARAG